METGGGVRRGKREVEEEVNCTWTIQVGKSRTDEKYLIYVLII